MLLGDNLYCLIPSISELDKIESLIVQLHEILEFLGSHVLIDKVLLITPRFHQLSMSAGQLLLFLLQPLVCSIFSFILFFEILLEIIRL